MRARSIVVSFFLAACSGGAASSATPPPTQQATTTRVADVPATECPRTRASVPIAADATFTACHTDADCTEGQNGRCIRISNHGGMGPSLEATGCTYDRCFVDAD